MSDDHSPGLTLFFAQAAKLPLLTADQEVELAKRVKDGDHVAMQKLVEHNIRLAVSIAKNYRNRGLPFEDLVQEGVLGLHRAASKFDGERGFRFSTYATWWIKHFLQRAVQNTGATIRTPGHILVRRLKGEAYLRENPDANLEQLAKVMDCRTDQVEEALDMTRVVASLDSMLDDGASAHERLTDERGLAFEDELPEFDMRVRTAVRALPPDESTVIKLRFGFDGPVRGRDEIAELMGVKPHVVQRLQKSALARLGSELGTIVFDGGGGLPPGDRRGATSSSSRDLGTRAAAPVTCRRAEPVCS